MAGKSIPTFALGRLPQLLIEERQSLCDFGDHVSNLSKELKQTQSLLEDLDVLQHVDGIIRRHIADLRELCFDLENAIEKFIVVGRFKRFGKKKQVVKLIQSVRSKISELNERVHECGIKAREIGVSSKGISERKLHTRPINPTVTEEFIGRERDIETLLSFLVENKGSQVVSLHGMGGLGKTTLAKKLYQNNEVQRHFQRSTLVHVSQTCEATAVLRQILFELTKEMRKEVQELCDQLRKVFMEKKCLVVLDDVWTLENDLKLALHALAGSSSRILITTRNKGVAETGYCYPLGGMSQEESWKLFSKRALPMIDDTATYKEMKKIGKTLVEWCRGLPLAILVLGGLLVNKHTLDEWKRVQEKLGNFSGESTEFSNLHKEVATVLSLSYTDLPYKKKSCFLYLANFAFHSRTKLICDSELYCMWIAEGLVSLEERQEGETMMEVAQRYMDELHIRSMVNYRVKGVAAGESILDLHDLMWELCVSKATESGFLTSISIKNIDDQLRNKDVTNRLSINVAEDVRFRAGKFATCERLRSISVFAQHKGDQLFNVIPHLLAFTYLKVLYVNGFTFSDHEILNGIEKLIHLRALLFEKCTSIIVPSSLGSLPYLQLLLFRRCSKVIIPNILWKLKRLVFLYLPSSCDVQWKLRVKELNELEILDNFNPSFCDVADISSLDLKKLGVTLDGGVDKDLISECLQVAFSKPLLHSSLGSLDSENLMQQLSSCSQVHQMFIHDPISDLSVENFSFLQNIVFLGLQNCGLVKDIMGTLEKLPKLEQLLLAKASFIGKEMRCSATGFPQLRLLFLDMLQNLSMWTIEQGAMPNLQHLMIFQCKKLEMLPEGLRYITSLQEVEIQEMPETFVSRLLKTKCEEGGDYDKIRHVPSIVIK